MNRPASRERLLRTVELVAISAVLVLCCILCRPAFNAIYLEVGCFGDETATSRPSVEELLLDLGESAFPNGWRAREPFDPEEWLPAEQIGLFYDHECAVALLEVYRFSDDPRCAATGYQKQVRGWFARWDEMSPWAVPAELPYRSSVADQYRFNCCSRPDDSHQVCQAAAQYEEYVVVFLAHLSPDCMTFTELESILVAIDGRMAPYLGKEME
ncbi:MAG: hypothetical protein GTO63_27065 [Anaerolineae bacterium]|nr:hypothetical protein [Anaerolineae bacterium]NIN98393.1 hypothetical protein [Anaerolineae bacterium]NIQ81308.1 hypothetical protein [Anaerolineae bacterium]